MSFASMREAVQTRFRDLVVVPSGISTLVLDNGPDPTGIKTKWCRLRINVGNRQQLTFGGVGASRFRTTGSATAEFAYPGKQGSLDLAQMFDTVKDAFQGVTLTSP